jgi:hypothetical protein
MEQRYHVYDRHAKGLGQEQVPTGKSMWNIVCVAQRSACPVRWRVGVVPDLTSQGPMSSLSASGPNVGT